ncbi:SIS domain-containing protein [Fluviispira multicolorata]|uniref:SIS domain-containing protein n=2 Tax=Fluviispira multicolorata TaxID=2654512 RepID=A0A833N4L8_9BACT|nr:SIS domain-containing protein [Fluviispira multicolorata]
MIFFESTSPIGFAKNYLHYLKVLLDTLELEAIEKFIKILFESQKNGHRIFFIGNGGSAATASHFSNDLSIGTRCLENPFKAISLTDNNAIITAISNDFGYNEIFIQQLKAQGFSKNEVLVSISASGNSENVLKAVEYATEKDGITIGLTGFDGGLLKKKCQLSIHVDTNKGEYGPVEDIHMILDHLIHAYLLNSIHLKR